MRLRWRLVGAVKVRSCAVKNRVVSNRNCVVETRGGEQRNENGQSVTPFVGIDEQSELDSVGGDGRACERCAKPVAEGETLWHPRSGLEKSPATFGHSTDGWRRNGWKTKHSNQGDRLGSHGVHASRRSKSRPRRSQSTHSSDETSNDRGAKGVQEDGRKLNRTTDQTPLRVPARAVPQRILPSAYDLDDTAERKAALETARRACSLSSRPHRPESRMREIRPSGSEGGVAPTRHPYPYRSARLPACGLWRLSNRPMAVQSRCGRPRRPKVPKSVLAIRLHFAILCGPPAPVGDGGKRKPTYASSKRLTERHGDPLQW